MLDHVGEKLNTPVLDRFPKSWINMFSRSMKSKLAWKTKTGLFVQTYSSTQCWSRWEMLKQVHDCFRDVVLFITNGDAPTANKSNLLELLSNPTKSTQLQMELTIV